MDTITGNSISTRFISPVYEGVFSTSQNKRFQNLTNNSIRMDPKDNFKDVVEFIIGREVLVSQDASKGIKIYEEFTGSMSDFYLSVLAKNFPNSSYECFGKNGFSSKFDYRELLVVSTRSPLDNDNCEYPSELESFLQLIGYEIVLEEPSKISKDIFEFNAVYSNCLVEEDLLRHPFFNR